MNLETLRQWVRGELDPATRRQVGRWILRASNPDLPEILYGLVREFEHEQADLTLVDRSPGRAFVVDLWRYLLDQGQATIEALRPAAMAGGPVLGWAASDTHLAFRNDDPNVVVDLALAGPPRLVALIGTTDLGDEHLLVKPTVLEPGNYAGVASWFPEPGEGRVTVWLVLAPATADASALSDLASAEHMSRNGDATIVAYRWSDPE